MRDPTLRPLTELDDGVGHIDDGVDHMTFEAFVEAAAEGDLIDDDGFGELATVDSYSDVVIMPSDVAADAAAFARPAWATHVVWYNR